jgi:hypothetical protein
MNVPNIGQRLGKIAPTQGYFIGWNATLVNLLGDTCEPKGGVDIILLETITTRT